MGGKLTSMARITSWQSYAAGGVMSATNRSSKLPWVSPFTSSCNVYSVTQTQQVPFYIQAYICATLDRTHANIERPHLTSWTEMCITALNV